MISIYMISAALATAALAKANDPKVEVDTYMIDNPSSVDTGTLDWWRGNQTRIPRLASLVRRYLCIPATSVCCCIGSVECNFSEHTEHTWCSGAVGQLLLFHLPHTANTEIKLKKDNKSIFKKQKNQKVTLYQEYVNQTQLFTNGTFKLGKALKKHSGDYQLEEHGSDGLLLKEVKVHLEIQAPVSKPEVSQMCSSAKQMNINCSSEGDGVEFSLTLDGLLLVKTSGHSQSLRSWTENMQPLAGGKTEQDTSSVTISLHSQLTGNLTCHVWNNVSRDETAIHLTDCQAVRSHFPVVALRAVVVTLLLLALCLGICHVHKLVKEGKII